MPDDPLKVEPPGNEESNMSPDSVAPSTEGDTQVSDGGEQESAEPAIVAQSTQVQPPILDVHSVPAEVASPEATQQAPSQAEGAPPPVQPAAPIIEATVHATQTAVSTVKQATQQVTAAVQQEAQKVTVAPRKAIYRGKRFLIGYGALTAGFGVLAALAKRYKYFPADVGITRVLQRPNTKLYDKLMHAVSNLGWRWISVGTRASLSTLMWMAGFRMEGAFTLSTWSGDVMTVLIKTRVLRPRPTKDLVRVTSDLDEASFPSGHVVHYVTFYGFLYYLVYTHLKTRWFRTLLLSILGGIITLVGPSRIYMGHHWPSDVGGAYFVGTLWLGITIIAYLETKANYTLHTHPPFLVKRPQQLGKS
ncbi:MAG TPA: phosphatase PAP2 family protein [Chloroflexia bacterium]|nr:phosphatase PAP2 family protein [Chloroflexia bacterium]